MVSVKAGLEYLSIQEIKGPLMVVGGVTDLSLIHI